MVVEILWVFSMQHEPRQCRIQVRSMCLMSTCHFSLKAFKRVSTGHFLKLVVYFRKSKYVLNFSRASFDYILFFLPSTRCFSHLAYNSYLLINPIELCGRFLVDYSGTWRRNFKHHPILSESIAESLVASNIMSFRRRIHARGNDLFTAFSCEALLKDFHTT